MPRAVPADTAHLCRPGCPCPWEEAFVDGYVASANSNYTECTDWLTEDERDQIIRDLAVLSLRRRRLSSLVAREGFGRSRVHPVSGREYGRREALGVGRYMTIVATQLDDRVMLLLSGSEAH